MPREYMMGGRATNCLRRADTMPSFPPMLPLNIAALVAWGSITTAPRVSAQPADVLDTTRVLRPFQDDVTTRPGGSLFTSASPPAEVARVLARVAPLPGNECSYAFGVSSWSRGAEHKVGHHGFREDCWVRMRRERTR